MTARALLAGLTALTIGAVCVSSMPVKAFTSPLAMAAEGELLRSARTYLTDRAARLTTGPLYEDRRVLTRVPVSAALRERLAGDAAAIDRRRERLRSVNGGHKGAQVTVENAKFRHENEAVAILYLDEHTELFSARTLTGGPPAESYRLSHRFTFHKSGGSWVIAEMAPDLEKLPPDTHPSSVG